MAKRRVKRTVRIIQGPNGGHYYVNSKGVKKYVGNTRKGKYAGATRRARPSTTRPTRLSGRGDYKSAIGGLARSAGSSLGGKIGGLFGGSGIGSSIGGSLGGMLGKFMGFGDYKFRRNTLLGIGGKATMGGPPLMNSSPTGSGVIINHREYIGDLVASTKFKSVTYDVNAGDNTTFPWLSTVAAQFETYEMLGCAFFYESHSANALNSVNTALGKVMMSSLMNSATPDFTNQREMMNTAMFSSGKPSEHLVHPIECAPGANVLDTRYVRVGSKAALGVQDIQFYDLCKVQLATIGQQAADVGQPGYTVPILLGSVFISYNVLLKDPVLGAEKVVPYAQYQCSGDFDAPDTPLGNTPATKIFDNIGITLGEDYINFPVALSGQQFIVSTYWVGTSSPNFYQYDTGPNGKLVNAFNNKTAAFAPGAISTGTTFLSQVAFEVGDGGLFSQLSYEESGDPAIPGDITYCTVTVTSINTAAAYPPVPGPNLAAAAMLQDPYEKRLRGFITAPANRHLSDEAKITLFDRLEAKGLVPDAPRGSQRETKHLAGRKRVPPVVLKNEEPEERKEEHKEDYVDLMTTSQLLNLAVQRSVKK